MKIIETAIVAASLALLSIAVPATATSSSTDQSDLWWVDPPGSENGWGIQFVQRGITIFATMFVYSPSGDPTWYVGTMEPTVGYGCCWGGDLYTASGSWFGTVPYNAGSFVPRKVGTIGWRATSETTGNLVYRVDGVWVGKSLTRQTITIDDFSGTFLGAFHDTTTGCADPINNVPPSDDPAVTIAVTQNGPNVGIVLSHPGFSISIAGTLTQSGQFGSVNGTYSSSAGEVGNANVSALNVQTHSLTGNFSLTSTNNGCQNDGYFSGMRAS